MFFRVYKTTLRTTLVTDYICKMLTVLETMAQFLKTLHKTHTQHTKHHTHLAKANTYLKTVLTLLIYIFFLHSNSAHKHIIISHKHAKLHTDVKNLKHYSCRSFVCSECSGAQDFFIAFVHTVHACNTVYTVCMMMNFTQLCN